MTDDDRKFIEEFKEEVSGCKAMNIGIGIYLKDGERLLSIIESMQQEIERLKSGRTV